MFRTLRMALALVLAFALQTTVAPYFRVWGVSADLLLYALVSLSIHCGQTSTLTIGRVFAGLCLGFGASLLLEATSVEAPGLTTVVHGLAGLYGALMPANIEGRLAPGTLSKRARKRLAMTIPAFLMMGAALAKESLYVIYFYLGGVALQWLHVARVLWSGLLAFSFGLIGHALLIRWINRPLRKTWYGRLWARLLKGPKPKAVKKLMTGGDSLEKT